MKMDLQTLCEKVQRAVPTARATAIPEMNQVIVTFTNRPDVEVALLTPNLQMQLRKGGLDEESFSALLFSVRRVSIPQNW